MHACRSLLAAAAIAIWATAPAHAATLPDAITHWTGVTPDVEGRGERVRIVLPPQSQVPAVTARASATTRAGEPGWRLTDIAIPVPARLSGGGRATIRTQHASGWLGDRTADATGLYDGITVDNDGTLTRIDHAAATVTAANGPVQLDLDLAGLHITPTAPGAAPLLPHHVVLRGHTTQNGIAALSRMFNGQHSDSAPVSIDTLTFDVGPATFTGTGSITFVTAHDRRGRVTLDATGFGDLMQAMPLDDQLVRLYPVMMVLRQMAHKQNGHLTWTADFSGTRIMVNGLDIAPLLGA